MAAQRADRKTMIRQCRLERGERGTIFKHGELAMRVSGVIAGCQLDRFNLMALELLQDFVKRELGQQWGEYADSHDGIRDKAISSRGAVATDSVLTQSIFMVAPIAAARII